MPSKKRRPYGSGTLFKRKSDGRWIGRVVVGQDDAGRPIKRQVSGKTKKEAAGKFGALLEELEPVTNVDLSF